MSTYIIKVPKNVSFQFTACRDARVAHTKNLAENQPIGMERGEANLNQIKYLNTKEVPLR